MLEQITEAIKAQDYQTARQLLEHLQQQKPDNPWIGFYEARLAEAIGNFSAASEGYRQLLRDIPHPKILSQARQGLQRIASLEEHERQQALAQVMEEAGSQEMGMLVLEPIPTEQKQAAAQKFAEILKMDAYSARLQLPSRAWRLYRTGAIGELQFLGEALQKAEIPCFWVKVSDITQLSVYPVLSVESLEPQVTVVYQPQKGQRDIFSFAWSEVTGRVEGLLPLFEECVEIGLRGKLERKTQTLDYAKFCDLHLSDRNTIVRLCDQTYHFHQGVTFSERQMATDGSATAQDSWNHIHQCIEQQLPQVPVWSEFAPFADSAIDFQELLKLIDPHIDLLRREDTPWDGAFQLYSGLAFVRGTKT